MKKLLLLTCFSAITLLNLHAQRYPTGFAQGIVASGINNATVMAFAPDGRIFIAEQGGKLHICLPDYIRSGLERAENSFRKKYWS